MGFDPVRSGRIGGLSRAARYDGLAVTAKARATYSETYLSGHACAVCPPIEIPAGLPDAEQRRRADALRKLHLQRMALRSAQVRARRWTKKAAPFANGTAQEVDDVRGITTTAQRS